MRPGSREGVYLRPKVPYMSYISLRGGGSCTHAVMHYAPAGSLRSLLGSTKELKKLPRGKFLWPRRPKPTLFLSSNDLNHACRALSKLEQVTVLHVACRTTMHLLANLPCSSPIKTYAQAAHVPTAIKNTYIQTPLPRSQVLRPLSINCGWPCHGFLEHNCHHVHASHLGIIAVLAG